LIFIVPILMGKLSQSPQINANDISAVFILIGLAALLIEAKLAAFRKDQNSDFFAPYLKQIIALALLEFVVILGVMSMLSIGDLVSYLLLGILGIGKIGIRTYSILLSN
jgi:hypothetical protein